MLKNEMRYQAMRSMEELLSAHPRADITGPRQSVPSLVIATCMDAMKCKQGYTAKIL